MNINKKWAPGSKRWKGIGILKEDARIFLHQALIPASLLLPLSFSNLPACHDSRTEDLHQAFILFSSHPFHFFRQMSLFLQRRQQHRTGVHGSLCCGFCPPLFFIAFSTWAELQVQLVCVITSGSCSSELSPGWDDRLQRQKTATPTRPPLPFLLSTLQHDWRLLIGIGVMLLTPFMHLSLPHSNLYETGVQWRNGEPADCPLKDAISSVQFSSAVMTYTGYT